MEIDRKSSIPSNQATIKNSLTVRNFEAMKDKIYLDKFSDSNYRRNSLSK
jgi:hypothetical protein